jgi:hypothetical protein
MRRVLLELLQGLQKVMGLGLYQHLVLPAGKCLHLDMQAVLIAWPLLQLVLLLLGRVYLLLLLLLLLCLLLGMDLGKLPSKAFLEKWQRDSQALMVAGTCLTVAAAEIQAL